MSALSISPVEIPTISIRDWAYRGEGNANLVISLPRERSVLRFAKSKYHDKDHDSDNSEITCYVNGVMRPLLGEHFVRPLRLGYISVADFERIRKEVQPLRPAKRIKKNIKGTTVIISPDCSFLPPEYERFTGGDTLSVEIKPKQGWYSSKTLCSSGLCVRCLKQYAKLLSGEIDVISSFCPLDLFSGIPSRMKKAILELYESPHNRFKIFVNGNPVYTEAISNSESAEKELESFFGTKSMTKNLLASLLVSSLLGRDRADEIVNVVPEKSDASSPTQACNTDFIPLPEDCVLARILSVQKYTELSDKGAKYLCDKLLCCTDNLEGLNNLILWYNPEISYENLSEESGEDIRKLRRFLMSATAKDVSVLCTFKELLLSVDTPPPASSIRIKDKIYRYCISVIDLDPKPVHRIASNIEKKEEWLKVYLESSKRINGI